MRHWLRKFITTLIERFPLTLQGLAVLVIALAALRFFAFAQMDLVVFALAVCAIVIVCAVLLLVFASGMIMRYRQIKQNDTSQETRLIRVEAGYVNETGFTRPALAWIPLVSLSWEVVYPDGIETRNRLNMTSHGWEEYILAHRRCYSQTIVRRFTLSDVLGFCRFSWRVSSQQALLALPQKARLKQLPLLRSLTAEDGLPHPTGSPEGDRMEIRPYVPGDSVRNIMWKVYARNRHLNVRLAEKSIHHSNRTLAYLLGGPGDEPAAAAARVAIETGALGEDWVFGADLCAEPSSNPVTAVEMTARSRALDGRNAYALDAFLQSMQQQGSLNCIVFAGAATGPWLAALRKTVARYPGRYTVVLATDGLGSDETPALWRRLLFSETNTEQTAVQGVREVARLLTQLGQFVESSLLVDRQSGQTYDRHMKRITS